MPNRSWYPSPGPYLRCVQQADRVTAAGGKVQLFRGGPELDAAEWKREKERALDARINAKGGIEGRGRKWSWEYQTDLMRDARALHDWLQKRIIVRRLNTPALNARFKHLLYKDWE